MGRPAASARSQQERASLQWPADLSSQRDPEGSDVGAAPFNAGPCVKQAPALLDLLAVLTKFRGFVPRSRTKKKHELFKSPTTRADLRHQQRQYTLRWTPPLKMKWTESLLSYVHLPLVLPLYPPLVTVMLFIFFRLFEGRDQGIP